MAQTIPTGTRVRILPPRNAAGRIIPDKYELAGKLGSVVEQTGKSSIMIKLDIGGEWRVALDRIAIAGSVAEPAISLPLLAASVEGE
jgi:hypothetical protein